MLLELLRMTRGWVEFSVNGRFPERFINITSQNRVRVWNVRRKENGFTASMYRSDYRAVRPLARGAGVRLRILRKNGMPTFIYRYRDRVGVLIGVCVFFLTLFVMSQFIWSIDITGLDTVSLTDMQSLLKEHGLYVGAYKPLLDDRKLSRDIMIERHEIGWMAVNVTGSYASVEIKEEAAPPKVEDIHIPCNIKAGADGVLLRIEAAEGETLLTEGSGVIKGQLLVSGVKTDEKGTARLVHADARILARTTRQASFTTAKRFTAMRPTGETSRQQLLTAFGLRLPTRIGSVDSPYFASDSQTVVPAPLGIRLPVGSITETVSAMEEQEITLDENSAKELLLAEAALHESFALQECEVESREERLSCENDVYTLSVTYTCVEDIAVSEPIGTDENTDLTPYVAPTQKKE